MFNMSMMWQWLSKYNEARSDRAFLLLRYEGPWPSSLRIEAYTWWRNGDYAVLVINT
jgi:hypothetical protein